ncbi:MAG TPA: hypothetical protein VNP90_07605 [Actinomycetota bacterium]|nr:hypothetical protein [Actinomycetota bacterium]
MDPLIFFLAYPAIRADQMTSLRNLKTAAESSNRANVGRRRLPV